MALASLTTVASPRARDTDCTPDVRGIIASRRGDVGSLAPRQLAHAQLPAPHLSVQQLPRPQLPLPQERITTTASRVCSL